MLLPQPMSWAPALSTRSPTPAFPARDNLLEAFSLCPSQDHRGSCAPRLAVTHLLSKGLLLVREGSPRTQSWARRPSFSPIWTKGQGDRAVTADAQPPAPYPSDKRALNSWGRWAERGQCTGSTTHHPTPIITSRLCSQGQGSRLSTWVTSPGQPVKLLGQRGGQPHAPEHCFCPRELCLQDPL